jgi:HSP20 family protein
VCLLSAICCCWCVCCRPSVPAGVSAVGHLFLLVCLLCIYPCSSVRGRPGVCGRRRAARNRTEGREEPDGGPRGTGRRAARNRTEGREEPDDSPVTSGPDTAATNPQTDGRKSARIFARQYESRGFFACRVIRRGMSALRDALRDLPEAVFADLLESEDAYLLVVDLPGTTAETVDVNATSGRIQVEALREKEVPEGFSYESEERSLFLDADLPVPDDANPHEAAATVDRGVLELSLPKGAAETGTTIAVEDE